MKSPKLSQNLHVYATIGLISVFVGLWLFQTNRENTYLENRIADEALRIDHEITETINQTSKALERYASRIALLGSSNTEFLELDSHAYLNQLPILKRIGIIDSENIVRWSYPKNLEDQVRGFDQGYDSNRLVALTIAKMTRKAAFSKAIELKSGGTGFLLPVALYRKDVFAGYAYATVEAKKLFNSFTPTQDFQIAIIENGKKIFDSPNAHPLDTGLKQSHKMLWQNGAWTLEITPTEALVRKTRSKLSILILIFGILSAFIVGALLRWIAQARNLAMANAEWKKALINSSTYGIISTDSQGIIRTFNSAAKKMLGYEADELIGKHSPKIFTLQADRPTIAEENEQTFVRKDKSMFPASLTITALRNEDGEVQGYLWTFSDLTERKWILDQLKSSNERLQRLIASSEEGLWEREYTSEGKILFIDDQAKKIFGFGQDENPTYEEIREKFSKKDMNIVAAKIDAHVENKTPGFDIEIKLINDRWIRAKGRIVNEPGKTPLLVSTLKDITDTKQ